MKHIILTDEQGTELLDGLTVDGEVELYMPIDKKPPRFQEVQKIGTFTVTRYDAPPKSKTSEYVRIGFRFAQYFKRQIKKILE